MAGVSAKGEAGTFSASTNDDDVLGDGLRQALANLNIIDVDEDAISLLRQAALLTQTTLNHPSPQRASSLARWGSAMPGRDP